MIGGFLWKGEEQAGLSLRSKRRRGRKVLFYKTRTINQKTFSFTKKIREKEEVIDDDCTKSDLY